MMRPLCLESPLLLLVTLGAGPYAASIRSELGGTVTFRVVNGAAPFGVVSSDTTNFPVTMNPDGKGFGVTVRSGVATGTAATLTVTDAASATAQITLNIVA
jgi:hypothetical protein